MYDVVAIGQRIKARREQLGLTLDDVAQRIGVTKGTVSRYENGVIARLKVPVLESIARVLDMEPKELIDPSSSPTYSKTTITPEQISNYFASLSDDQLLATLQELAAIMAERRMDK